MASFLRPRRGKKATAVAQLTASNPLKRGEVFFEVPDTGVGTGVGKIKMGDGATAYASLPYFLEQPTVDYTNAVVGWTDTSAADSDPYTTNATYAGNIVPSASLKTIFTNLKKLLLNYNSQLTSLNNDLGSLSFSQDGSGNWGYKVGGADTVYPFKKGYENTPGNATPGDITSGVTAWVNGVKITGTRPAPISRLSGSFTSSVISPGQSSSGSVTFSKSFDRTPKVSVSRVSNGDGCNGYWCRLSNITRNGFSWTIGGQQYGSDSITYNYTAYI